MILRPEQIKLMRLGLPATPCNFGRSDSSSSSTNTTTTQTQDRRVVTDGGSSSVSADNSTVTVTDNGAVNSALSLAAHLSDLGAGMQATNASLTQALAKDNNQTALTMFSHGIDLEKAIAQQGQQVLNQGQAVVSAATQLATAPMNAQNPDRYLLIAGMAIIGVVAFAATKGKG
ncbi:hypothetical protein FP568_11245 [Pandoraea pnomenusa]|uniref:hypothetical protein n=1 Tax=Pandoraea pnomenusa TaxID=93220 RepID=UPI001198AB41|nr:hypothetical protein [Pandoraea pnomenusa]QDX21768.1 hypothetical protein FP568_11245 [Pandoraea pnomenusa]